MMNTFYLMTRDLGTSPWYMLIVRDTHYCLSSGSQLDKIFKLLRHYVKTYRTKERLLHVLSELEDRGRVSPATFKQREVYFQAHGEDYADLINKVVREALAEAREEDRANSPLNKARTRLQKAGGVKTTTKPKEVSPKVDSTTPTILRKPKVFKRK